MVDTQRILVTGGAGFIGGTNPVNELRLFGYRADQYDLLSKR